MSSSELSELPSSGESWTLLGVWANGCTQALLDFGVVAVAFVDREVIGNAFARSGVVGYFVDARWAKETLPEVGGREIGECNLTFLVGPPSSLDLRFSPILCAPVCSPSIIPVPTCCRERAVPPEGFKLVSPSIARLPSPAPAREVARPPVDRLSVEDALRELDRVGRESELEASRAIERVDTDSGSREVAD